MINCKYYVSVVLITYNPNAELLQKSLRSLCSQVDEIILVDNYSSNRECILDLLEIIDFGVVNTLLLNENRGIGFATNLGIKSAKNDMVLISDQDTIYPMDYISKMLNSYNNLDLTIKNRVACISPVFFDQTSGKVMSLYEKNPLNHNFYEVYQAIASGMLLKKRTFHDVGPFLEDLFIDWVDFEWCWRAGSRGYLILREKNSIIHHKVGDNRKTILGVTISTHDSVRCYYITRNAFYLYLYSPDINIVNKIFGLFSSFKYVVFYPLFSEKKIETFILMIKALSHGVFKKLGPLH